MNNSRSQPPTIISLLSFCRVVYIISGPDWCCMIFQKFKATAMSRIHHQSSRLNYSTKNTTRNSLTDVLAHRTPRPLHVSSGPIARLSPLRLIYETSTNIRTVHIT